MAEHASGPRIWTNLMFYGYRINQRGPLLAFRPNYSGALGPPPPQSRVEEFLKKKKQALGMLC